MYLLLLCHLGGCLSGLHITQFKSVLFLQIKDTWVEVEARLPPKTSPPLHAHGHISAATAQDHRCGTVVGKTCGPTCTLGSTQGPLREKSEEAERGGQNDSGSEVEDYRSCGPHSLERMWQVTKQPNPDSTTGNWADDAQARTSDVTLTRHVVRHH